MNIQESHLLKASFRGDLKKIKEMLLLGTNINAQGGEGDTALLYATRGNQFQAIQLLCEQKANIHHRNHYKKNALIEALFSGCDSAIVEYLLMQGAKFDHKVLYLAWRGDDTVFKKSASLNIKDRAGHSLVHYLMAGHHFELIKNLKEQLNLFSKVNYSGQTDLHIAIRCNSLPITQWLLQNGSNASARDRKGNTALLTAAQCGHLEIAQWLLADNKMRILEKNSWQLTALHNAVVNNQLKLVKWLIENKLISASDKLSLGELCTSPLRTDTLKWYNG